MSSIDEIMGAVGRHGDDCIRDADAASASFEGLRKMIAAALADARREGAEAIREKAAQGWDGCMYDAPGETIDIGADIRAMPLPTGPRQAVLLTDAEALAALPDCHGSSLGKSWLLAAARAIETAALAKNGLEVCRG